MVDPVWSYLVFPVILVLISHLISEHQPSRSWSTTGNWSKTGEAVTIGCKTDIREAAKQFATLRWNECPWNFIYIFLRQFRGLIMPCWGVKLQREQKSFLFCWFCVPETWTGSHGASVPTPHTGQAQGLIKTDSALCKICRSQNKDKVLTSSQIILELKFTIFYCEFLCLVLRL